MFKVVASIIVVASKNLAFAQLDFQSAPVMNVEPVIREDVAEFEFLGKTHCEIYADEVVVFICTEDVAKKNGGVGLTEEESILANQIVIADAKSMFVDINCIDNCIQGVNRDGLGPAFDFLKIEDTFIGNQVKSV